MYLVEILLPLTDSSGKDFPAAYYENLATELVASLRRHHELSARPGGGPLAR